MRIVCEVLRHRIGHGEYDGIARSNFRKIVPSRRVREANSSASSPPLTPLSSTLGAFVSSRGCAAAPQRYFSAASGYAIASRWEIHASRCAPNGIVISDGKAASRSSR